jgi:putative tryptophan/tyrosine transport system substrate-binding protein
MNRREFIGSMGVAAIWPAAARAQQSPVIGFLGATSAANFKPQVEGFLKGLSGAGYVAGRNVTIEYRWAEGRYERLPGLAAELAALRVDMVMASSPPAAVAAKAAIMTTPVVFVVGTDPISIGLVESLNRPGGNLTGMYLYISGLVAKKLELLREIAPAVNRFAVVSNPGTPSEKLDSSEIEAVNRGGSGTPVSLVKASTEAEIDSVFAELADRKAAAVIGTDAFYFAHRAHIAEVAARLRVPAIHYAREFVIAGGLMSYGANIPDIDRQAGVYAARVLKGEKPSDMPVQQPTTFELAINLKAAKELGLNVAPSLLTLADEVSE